MSNLIKVNNHNLQIKEFNSQRVVTFKDIDILHERADGTAGRNFRENRKHFINGVDYFQRNSSEAKNEFGIIAPNGLTLITESGYLMLVKSLTDDLAWTVQRQLVNNYFRVKENKPQCIEDVLIQSLQEMKALRYEITEAKKQTAAVEQKVEDIREVIIINPKAEWRKETNKLISKICYKLQDYKTPKDEIYRALEERGKCKLSVRLKNLQDRAKLNGMIQSQIDKLNNLDVISNDVRLKEIYITIVKEMAIKHGIKAEN